ncbi:hypothetical protein L9F63_019935 [Diploptera punctata]|uniref:Uncharacterized protein n=1 Tax=Diploptera punctata TaxID=6984 RepID=A0AAD8EDE6_DIPPU|nr:hypothetical protein L9F63_019935 [Diploptera punctata]
MFKKEPNSPNSPTGCYFLRTSSRPPVEIINHGQGVIEIVERNLENHLRKSIQTNLPNYELRTLPATKESENETFSSLCKCPHDFQKNHMPKLDGNVKNYSTSASSNLITKQQFELSLMNEKPPVGNLGSDSAPVLLNPRKSVENNIHFLEELKNCVYDPNKYLERCIALSAAKRFKENNNVHKTMKNISRDSFQSTYKKKLISSKSNSSTNEKLNLILSQPVSSDNKDVDKIKQSSKNIKNDNQVKKGTSNLSNKNSDISTTNKESKKSLISKNSSMKTCSVKHSTAFPSKKDINQTIQGGVSKIVISPSKTKTDIKNNTKSTKNDHVQQNKSNLPKTLVVVTESQNNETINKCSENYKDFNVKTIRRPNTQEEIVHWLNKSQQIQNQKIKLGSKQRKRKKLPTYNTKRGRIRHITRNHTMDLIMEKIKVLLEPSSTELIKAFSDSDAIPPSRKSEIMSRLVLNILMDTTKGRFLKGISSPNSKNESLKIQKPLSAPNQDLVVDMLLDKLQYTEHLDLPLAETDKNLSNESVINGKGKDSASYIMASDISSSAETINPSRNIYSKEDAISIHSSTLANYLGSETSSEKLEYNNYVTGNEEQRINQMQEMNIQTIETNIQKQNDQHPNIISYPILKQLYSADLQSSASSKEFDDMPVIDVISDPPTVLSIEKSQGEISEISFKSGSFSKPPPHPRYPKRTKRDIIKNSQNKVELSSYSDTTRGRVVDQVYFQSLKDIKINCRCRHKCQQNCIIEPVKGLDKFPQYSRQCSCALARGNDFTDCHEMNACFTEQFPKRKINEKSLQWSNSSSQPMCDYQSDIDPIKLEEMYNEKVDLPNMQTKCGYMWKTPESFFKAYRYLQNNTNFRCNGCCRYTNPNEYTELCSPCQRMRAENLSTDYMERILGRALHKYVNKTNGHRNRHLRNAFMNAVHSRNAPHRKYFSKDKSNNALKEFVNKESLKENFHTHGPKAQTSKSTPSQLIPRPKLKKERPATSVSTSQKKDTTVVKVPIKNGAAISSSSTDNNCEITKNHIKSHSRKNVPSSSNTSQSDSSHHHERKYQYRRSQNRLSTLALPTIRYIEGTKDRYKSVLERDQLEHLDEIVIRKRVDKNNARIHCWDKRSVGTLNSNTSYQDTSSCSSSSSYAELIESKESKKKKRNQHFNMESNMKTKPEGITKDNYYGMKQVEKNSTKLKMFSDIDTVVLGRYIFIGVDESKAAPSLNVSSLHKNDAFLSEQQNMRGVSKIALNLRTAKSDNNKILPDEREFQRHISCVKPDHNFKTNTEKSLDNDVIPQHITCHIDKSPIERTCALHHENRTQKYYEDNTIGNTAIKLLEYNILNMLPTTKVHSSNFPYCSKSEINKHAFSDNLQRQMSESSHIGVQEQKRHFNIIGDSIMKTVLQAVPEDSLASLDSLTTQTLEDDSTFTNGSKFGSSVSTSSEVQGHHTKGIYGKIEAFLAGSDLSEFSDSDSSFTYSQPFYPQNVSSSRFVSNSSNTDTIPKMKQLECDTQVQEPETTIHTKVKTVEMVRKTNGKTILEVRTRRKSHESEVISNFNTNSDIQNPAATNSNMKNNAQNKVTYSISCQTDTNEQNIALSDERNLKNILQIKMNCDSNDIIISIASEHKQIYSSNSKHLTSEIHLDNFEQKKKIVARIYFITQQYNLYEAKVVYQIKCCVKTTFEHSSIFTTSKKKLSDYSTHSRYPIELLKEITANQVVYIESSMSKDIDILPYVELSANKNEIFESSINEMYVNGGVFNSSSLELLHPEIGYNSSPVCKSVLISKIRSFLKIENEFIDTVIISPFLEFTSSCMGFEETSNIFVHDRNNSSHTIILSSDERDENNYFVHELGCFNYINNSGCFESSELTPTSSHVLDHSISRSGITDPPEMNSLDLICLGSQQDIQRYVEDQKLSLHNLTTSDTENDLIAAFSHVPKKNTISLPTTENTQINFLSLSELNDLLESIASIDPCVITDEESFRSDLNSLKEFVESLTSVDSSCEGLEKRHVVEMRYRKQDTKLFNIASSFDMITESYPIMYFYLDDSILLEDFRNSEHQFTLTDKAKNKYQSFIKDEIKTVQKEMNDTIYREDGSHLLSIAGIETSYTDDTCVNTIQEETLENYLPDEEIKLILQNILSDVLQDIVNENKQDTSGMEYELNFNVNPQKAIRDLFPQSLEDKSIPITCVVGQIIKILSSDENLRFIVNILNNIICVNSSATQKLVQRIKSELTLIPKEEMELFMEQVFGLDPNECSLDSMFKNLCSSSEKGIHLNNSMDLTYISDHIINTTSLEEMDKEISKMHEILEAMADSPIDLTQDVSQYLLKNDYSLMYTEESGTSHSLLCRTEQTEDHDLSKLYNESLLNLTTSDKFVMTPEELSDDEVSNRDEGTHQILLDSEIDKNIFTFHSLINAEEEVISAAGDGIINPQTIFDQLDSTFNAWSILSPQHIIRNGNTLFPLNIQSSSLSVVVSNSVADYDASLSNSTAHSTADIEESDRMLINNSLTRLDNVFPQEITLEECVDLNGHDSIDKNSDTIEEKPKSSVILSRRTKAFATIYFILFSLLFGGLAFQTQCQ